MNKGERGKDERVGYGVLINKNDVPSPLANSLGRMQRRAESNNYTMLMLFQINTIYYFHYDSSNILSIFNCM